jgi:hypothetical protein
MKAHKGITLFECLIYITLFSIIASSSMFIITRLWRSFMHRSSIEKSRLTLYTAFDVLRKDIHTAPSLQTEWKLCAPAMMVWSLDDTQKKDRGWVFDGSKLMRIEGVFDSNQGMWKSKKHSSTIAELHEMRIDYSQKKHMSHITVYLSDGTTSIKETISLHNGPV